MKVLPHREEAWISSSISSRTRPDRNRSCPWCSRRTSRCLFSNMNLWNEVKLYMKNKTLKKSFYFCLFVYRRTRRRRCIRRTWAWVEPSCSRRTCWTSWSCRCRPGWCCSGRSDRTQSTRRLWTTPCASWISAATRPHTPWWSPQVCKTRAQLKHVC